MLNLSNYGRPAYIADADIIFLPGFYLFSSPNLSRRWLDV